MARRKATVTLPKEMEILSESLDVRGYDPSGMFICRLEITSAGINVFVGAKGKTNCAT